MADKKTKRSFLTEAWNIVGDNMNSQAGTSSAGPSFISTMLARMPGGWQILKDIENVNPKYSTFDEISPSRDERLQRLSVSKPKSNADDISGQVMINKDYHKFMYANIDLDKVRRIQEYRRMAGYAELSDCLDEICDEAVIKDEHGKITKFHLRGDYDKNVKNEITKEWDQFSSYFALEDKGWSYFRNLLVDGELYFENLISENKPNLGIVGVSSMPPELINPIYDNTQNGMIKGYLLRRIVTGPKRNMSRQDQEDFIPLNSAQVTYIHSGIWNEDKSIRMPYIENARRAYKQLSLVEDSIIIYRMVRAPERLVFKVDVGNMSPPKAEAYMKRMMNNFWSRKSFDTTTNRTTNVYDPLSQLDAYWLPKRAGTEGTTIDVLPGGANLGSLEDLMYFVKKLYKSLKVPAARLDSNDPFKDGSEITREELRFAKFIMRLQKQFASGLKTAFITHLKLRGLWKQHNISEHEIDITFNSPSNFMVMREQQILELKFNNFANITQNAGISNSFAQRYYLGLSDEEMTENRQWRRHDAALDFEIDQIRTAGSKWREQQSQNQEELGGAPGMPGGGGGGGGGGTALPGGFSPKLPPDFGGPAPTPETGSQQNATAKSANPNASSALPASNNK